MNNFFRILGKNICFLIMCCSVTMFALEGVAAPEKPSLESDFSHIQLTANDRILILAPHPDDEVLGCGGIIQKSLAMKLPVKVVFFTYGDNNQWSFLVYREHPVIFSKAVQGMGLVRHDEAVEADKALGLVPQQLVFLGYPDFGTLNIWYNHWDQRPNFVSMLTKVRAVPYKNAFRPGAPYKGEEILKDITAILKEFRPTKIFLSHPADHNGDHRALYLFTTVALWELGMDNNVKPYPFLVHYKYWPKSRGHYPGGELLPPGIYKQEISWQICMLNPEEVNRKENALKKHRSQFNTAASYLEAFIRRNELFGDFSKIKLGEISGLLPLSYNIKEDLMKIPEELVDEERASFVGIEKHTVSLENGKLVFSMNLSRKLSREVGLSVYLFGYRQNVSFAKMPKIHIRFGALIHGIYDQNKRIALRNSGINIWRKPRQIITSIPLEFLGNPERILTSANTYLGNIPLDWVSWRILELPKTAK